MQTIAFVDALIGPTYHYGGLAYGNVLSMSHKAAISYPKKAALEGLEKMKLVHDLGYRQYVLPPVIKSFDQISTLTEIADISTQLSASAAWMANACTVTSSWDSKDGRCHMTPANLAYAAHRSLDVPEMTRLLNALCDGANISLHPPVNKQFFDEGSANSVRLSADASKSVMLHVYGKENEQQLSNVFPARQSKEAFDVISTDHQILDEVVIQVQQHPDAIDAGVFHNDVICFGLNDVLVLHEKAFLNQKDVLNEIQDHFQARFNTNCRIIEISDALLPLKDAVQSYFFNSQILPKGDGGFILLLPSRCKELTQIDALLSELAMDCHFVDCEESIKNGGGPACLRFFIQDKAEIVESLNDDYLFTIDRYNRYRDFVNQHYPQQLSLADLLDLSTRRLLCELTQQLNDA